MRDVDLPSVADNERHQVSGCAGFGTEGRAVRVREEVLVTMEILDCRMYELCDKLDETTWVLRTTHDRDWVLLGQHGTNIAGDRVATSIR